MVAKVSTIKNKIKKGKKLGFSERARAVNKGLLPSKAKRKMKKAKAKIKKVIKGLNQASKLHAGQAKMLKGVLSGKKNKKSS